MEKRGLSTIITSLILIALALVAIGVVWVIISNVISQQEEVIDVQSQFVFLNIKSAEKSTGEISILLRRESGKGDILGVNFVFYDDTSSEVVYRDSDLAEYEQSTFVISLSELSEENVVSVSVAPVYGDAGNKLFGSVTDIYQFTGVSGEGDLPGDEDGCISESPETTCGLWICGGKTNNCNEIVNCGSCLNGECIEGVCVGCVPDCTGKECGSDGCGINNNCGLCVSGECVGGTCYLELAAGSGLIDLVWPPEVGLYFDSYDLSTETSYQGYYVRFPGSSEELCLTIYDYIFP